MAEQIRPSVVGEVEEMVTRTEVELADSGDGERERRNDEDRWPFSTLLGWISTRKKMEWKLIGVL